MSAPAVDADLTRTLAGAVSGAAGVGVDVVAISAFAAQLAEPGTRFSRAFTAGERRAARSSGSPEREAESLAARWAAKEALVKAWSGTRYGRPDDVTPEALDLREIEVRSDAWGRPALRLHGEVASRLHEYDALLSLSHDRDADTAVAFVVLTRKEEER